MTADTTSYTIVNLCFPCLLWEL